MHTYDHFMSVLINEIKIERLINNFKSHGSVIQN